MSRRPSISTKARTFLRLIVMSSAGLARHPQQASKSMKVVRYPSAENVAHSRQKDPVSTQKATMPNYQIRLNRGVI